jgi:UDP-glucose 4-epimerase
LVGLLVSKGYIVRVLVRNNRMEPRLPDIEYEVGDITDSASVKKAVSGVQIVFHLAAMLHNNNPGRETEQDYYRVNVTGTLNLLKASREHGVKRFIFFSTISVYGSGNLKTWLCEEDKVFPGTFYEKTKYDAERLIQEIGPKKGGPEITILRLASVYGTRIKGNYRTMIKMISKGFLIYPGRGRNKRTLVHEEDVARAALIAAQHPDAAGKIFNVTDGSIYTIRDIVDSILSGMDQKAFVLYLPSYPFRFFSCLAKKNVFSKVPLFRHIAGLIDTVNETVMVSGGKIIEELHFRPKWDLASGMKDAIRK